MRQRASGTGASGYDCASETSVEQAGNSRYSIRFPGQYYAEETGLHYNRFRYYDPSIGRYISADPIGQAGGVNVDSYAGNSATNWGDPHGLILERIWNDPAGRQKDFDSAVSASEFVTSVQGKALSDVQNEKRGGGTKSKAGGPKDSRFVLDPKNPNDVIDMRQLLVVGPQGEAIGLGGEIIQGLPFIGDPGSAFNSSDFLSNALGAEFFSTYDPTKPLSDQLKKFFEARGQTAPICGE